MVGVPAYEWVSKDALAVGGLVVAVGGCVGCGGSNSQVQAGQK